MRKKLIIELFIYIVIVVIGIIMLVTKPLDNKRINHDQKIGGEHNAIVSFQ